MFFFKPLSPSKANWSISRNPSKAPAPYCGCWLTNQPARRSLMRPWGHGSWWKAPNLVTMTLWICKSYEYPAIDLISRWHGCHTTFGHTNHPALSLPAFIYIYIDEWICIYIYIHFFFMTNVLPSPTKLADSPPVASWDVAQRNPLEASPKETARSFTVAVNTTTGWRIKGYCWWYRFDGWRSCVHQLRLASWNPFIYKVYIHNSKIHAKKPCPGRW